MPLQFSHWGGGGNRPPCGASPDFVSMHSYTRFSTEWENGTSMVGEWNLYGGRMEPLWWENGTSMVGEWNLYGGRMEPLWWENGTSMVGEWNLYGGRGNNCGITGLITTSVVMRDPQTDHCG